MNRRLPVGHAVHVGFPSVFDTEGQVVEVEYAVSFSRVAYCSVSACTGADVCSAS